MSQLLKQIVITELEDLADRIAANIKSNGQLASGDTARSLKVRKEGDTYTLYGRDSFESLEKGYKGPVSFRRIYNWIVAKGLQDSDPRKTKSFAFAIVKKIETEGSFLYRNKATYDGIIPDTYSTEIKETIKRLYDKLGDYAIRQIETITLNF